MPDWPVLSTTCDPNADAFVANRSRFDAMLDDLRAVTAAARLGGSERSRTRHVERGKLLPRDRVGGVLDAGSPFLELSALAAHGVFPAMVPEPTTFAAMSGLFAVGAIGFVARRRKIRAA